jgi:hypothetical protein
MHDGVFCRSTKVRKWRLCFTRSSEPRTEPGCTVRGASRRRCVTHSSHPRCKYPSDTGLDGSECSASRRRTTAAGAAGCWRDRADPGLSEHHNFKGQANAAKIRRETTQVTTKNLAALGSKFRLHLASITGLAPEEFDIRGNRAARRLCGLASRRHRSGDSGWRLRWQIQLDLLQQELQILGRLRVSRQDQPAPISPPNPHIDHLDRAQLFQHRYGRQARRVNLQSVLQCHLETVSQKRNQDMCVDAVLQLMMDRRIPRSVFNERNTASICVNCT